MLSVITLCTVALLSITNEATGSTKDIEEAFDPTEYPLSKVNKLANQTPPFPSRSVRRGKIYMN